MFNQPKDISEIIDKLKHLSSNNDIDIKGLALAYLDILKDIDPAINSFTVNSLAESGKNQTKIRTRWSTALSYRAENQIKKGVLVTGINLYKDAIKIWPKNVKAKKGLAEAYILVDAVSYTHLTLPTNREV